jgi:hypothetical protein
MGARKKRRDDRNEFQIIEIDNNENIILINHKFGSVLSVVIRNNGEKQVCCIPSSMPNQNEEMTSNEDSMYSSNESNEEGISKEDMIINAHDSEADDDDPFALFAYSKEDNSFETGSESSLSKDSQKWRIIRAHDGHACLMNVSTGDLLGISNQGRLIVFPVESPKDAPLLWVIEAVTGELCFLSNVSLDSRLRCDMGGRLSMSSNCKGWEVFRLLEAGDGFVKIASWMHSHWALRCNDKGEIQTGGVGHIDTCLDDEWCSLWAIERCISGNGVVIRSKTFGCFLCVNTTSKVWTTSTYHPFDEKDSINSNKNVDDAILYQDDPLMPHTQSELVRRALVRKREKEKKARRWFRRDHQNTPDIDEVNGVAPTLPTFDMFDANPCAIGKDKTMVWRLESAHMQNYFLSTSAEGHNSSIGPFPEVTPILRRTDKFSLVRKAIRSNDGGNEITIAQLFHSKKKEYVACSEDGKIYLVKNSNDETTEWIMTNSSFGGNSFQSKLYKFYLSYKYVDTVNGNENRGSKSPTSGSTFGFFHHNRNDQVAPTNGGLVGSLEFGKKECWDLAPCVPRGINSGRVRTFAIGTSLVLGSSLALPYALVSAGTMLHVGAGNAGVLYHVAIAGLSSVDAVSSVGALGATAYFVFQSQGGNLTDKSNHKSGRSEKDLARFKRPFADWRNWNLS